MMVRWMYGVPLKLMDQFKLECLLDIQSVVDAVRHSRLRWF